MTPTSRPSAILFGLLAGGLAVADDSPAAVLKPLVGVWVMGDFVENGQPQPLPAGSVWLVVFDDGQYVRREPTCVDAGTVITPPGRPPGPST